MKYAIAFFASMAVIAGTTTASILAEPEPTRDIEASAVEDDIAALRQRLGENSSRRQAEEAAWRAQYAARTQAAIAAEGTRRALAQKLATAMLTFGTKRLPGINRSAHKLAVYKRHTSWLAGLFVEVSSRMEQPLIGTDTDPYLLASIAYHESSWAQSVIDGRRRGLRGEVGMMQLMPNGVCSRGEEGDRRLDVLDPTDNIKLAVRCLEVIRARHEGDIWRWLAVYASGKPWPAGREAADEFRAIYQEMTDG